MAKWAHDWCDQTSEMNPRDQLYIDDSERSRLQPRSVAITLHIILLYIYGNHICFL